MRTILTSLTLGVSLLVSEAALAQDAPQKKLDPVHEVMLDSARQRGKTGIVLGAVVGGLGAVTAIVNLNPGDGTVPRVLGGMTLITAAVATPIAAGGAKARRVARSAGIHEPVHSLVPTAWVGYGLSMGVGTAILILGISGDYIGSDLILSTTALGSLSAVGMGLNAVLTARSVRTKLGGGSPSIVAAPLPDGGAGLFVTGRF